MPGFCPKRERLAAVPDPMKRSDLTCSLDRFLDLLGGRRRLVGDWRGA